MGTDYQPLLIFGWEIAPSLLKQLLDSLGEGTCEYQFYCDKADCWCSDPQRIGVPRDFAIIGCYPYLDAPLNEVSVFVAVRDISGKYLPKSDLDNLCKTVDWQSGKQFALQLGARDSEPLLMAQLHVW